MDYEEEGKNKINKEEKGQRRLIERVSKKEGMKIEMYSCKNLVATQGLEPRTYGL